MLVKACNNYQVAKRDYKEAAKGQYNEEHDRDGAKSYFRASELGNGDRKIVYSFFSHQMKKGIRGAKNLRALENGDFVHLRWQSAWDEMGILILPKKNPQTLQYDEVKLSSKDDTAYLAEFPWEWNGHYDALLDLNIIRAHAEGRLTLENVKDPETGIYSIDVTLDDDFAREIGMLTADGQYNEDYEKTRPTAVADIKSMNQFAFDRLVGNNDVREIMGYVHQIMFYMYMLGTPYGFIFIEDKGSNDICEVQLVWKDFDLLDDGKGGTVPSNYSFDPKYFGEQGRNVLRLVVDNDMFFGSEDPAKPEGIVPRIDRLWKIVEKLRVMDSSPAVDVPDFQGIMPMRCHSDPGNFPCQWGGKKGKPVEYCEFYDHCWDKRTAGATVRPFCAVPAEAVWEICVATDRDGGTRTIKLDSRKFPPGTTQEMLLKLMEMTNIDLTPFIIGDEPATTALPAAEAQAQSNTADVDAMFGNDGELKMTMAYDAPSEAVEYKTDEGARAIDCLNPACGKQITYTKLAAGYKKKCPHCGNVNKVKQG